MTWKSWTFELACEKATASLANDVAMALRAGDLVALCGDLGVGKTFFARSLIRSINDNSSMEVPSPTFTLMQEYQELQLPIAHLDLYRLSDPLEVHELNLQDWLDHGAALVEWPENGDISQLITIQITLEYISATCRHAVVRSNCESAKNLERSFSIRTFINSSGYNHANRTIQAGDASARRYERIKPADTSTRHVLMDAPRMPDGPPNYNGLTYSQAAHLAEDVSPFVAIGQLLRSKGFCAPEIYASDLNVGLLLLENLGDDKIIDCNGIPVADRYIACAQMLAHFHEVNWPDQTPISKHQYHKIPRYDVSAMRIGLSLLPDWWGKENELPEDAIINFYDLWMPYFEAFQTGYNDLILRDFHSPNILWQSHGNDVSRIGLIDYQDALIGPGAYDMASIVRDARVVIEPGLQTAMLEAYCDTRAGLNASFDMSQFLHDTAILSAFRNSRLLGLWVRLDLRDGKAKYRRYESQTKLYLSQALSHPDLGELREWYQRAGLIDG